MTALLYIIAICAFALVACLLAWFYERDLIDEAARIAADNDWSDWDDLAPESDTPIHTVIDPHADITYQAMCFERWEREQ